MAKNFESLVYTNFHYKRNVHDKFCKLEMQKVGSIFRVSKHEDSRY